MPRVGILGGTFNPPHLGHLICAEDAYLNLGLDAVVLMPARIPPHKPVEDEPGPEHRLEMCRRAVAGDPVLSVSSLEIEREGPSYTVDTLSLLHQNTPDTELFLIVGGDMAASLPRWREAEKLLSLATLAVAKRRGTARTAVEDALAELSGGERARFFRMTRVGISSTEIRRRVRSGQSIRYLVREPVADYIYEHHLYGGSTA